MNATIGSYAMILTPDEIAFLDAYCFEGTEPPFGGAATDVMASIGVHDGDTLNIQWAYLLLATPPSGPVIGNASKVAPHLPWPSREAVLRRDEEIRAIREETQNRGKRLSGATVNGNPLTARLNSGGGSGLVRRLEVEQ
jgi:hypothetical protein